MQKFIKLKELVTNTVSEDDEIFSLQLQSLLNLYKQSANEVNKLEEQIISLINDIQPKSMTIPDIGSLSVAVIYAEYSGINKFNSPSAILSFTGLESGYYQSGISEHGGYMVKCRSSNLLYTLMNLCIPLIQYNILFTEFYAKKHNKGQISSYCMFSCYKKTNSNHLSS